MSSKHRIFSDIGELADEADEIRRATETGFAGDERHGICGFDGFVDTFIELENPDRMESFGPKVAEAAGIATSFTARHKGDRFGGNGPLFASALHSFFDGETGIAYIGALGDPEVQPLFREALGDRTRRLVTLADPAHSDCLEFKDGKVMLSDLRTCADIHWDRLLERMDPDDLDEELRRCRFVGAVNWGKLVNVGSIWRGIADRLAAVGREAKEVPFFMDLAEFEQRPREDQKELVDLVGEITSRCETILSFNLKEAWQMAELFEGGFKGAKEPARIAELAAFLRAKIAVDRVVIHPNDGAACAGPDEAVYVPGPFCDSPLISTGAGDTFGAGVLAGRMMGFSDPAAILCGACASGHYVRTARFPSAEEIVALIDRWSTGDLPERL